MTFLGVTYQGRESVCIWELDEERAERIARRLNLELDLLQPYNGLAFTLDAQALAGMDVAIRQQFSPGGHRPGHQQVAASGVDLLPGTDRAIHHTGRAVDRGGGLGQPVRGFLALLARRRLRGLAFIQGHLATGRATAAT